ncbi:MULTISPECIES: sigma-70 family RNA polymerase sigma factor [Pontibacillus]|uniref:RNA polymerase sigma factor n=1 Tax=Pontibacillus chungwhensis TaxID=265426 RepID=A0ABY8V3U0_9BACI|nr:MULTISPECIES: sigma-70 family RNA polymerase sigma factor [Pontibacillus]MCD5322390.1 sigma-70 family RNA polymerase sigma factor [Pontibacillus sp. HN14]WIF99676.1 sigma-70 family RNA polymerase sigma factor [Pontibacillus chungwhensis]
MGEKAAMEKPPSRQNDSLNLLEMDSTEALEKIMDEYGDDVKRFVYTYVKNSADTDDITQETFLTVYKKLHTFQSKSSLRTWIFSIAINKSKDYLRSFHTRHDNLFQKIKSFITETQDDLTPETLVMRDDESSELINQILKLPLKYREVLILYYFNEFSIREISQSLNQKESSVKTRLNRARKKLAELLNEASLQRSDQ